MKLAMWVDLDIKDMAKRAATAQPIFDETLMEMMAEAHYEWIRSKAPRLEIIPWSEVPRGTEAWFHEMKRAKVMLDAILVLDR